MQGFPRIIFKHGYSSWGEKLFRMRELFEKAEYETVKRGLRKAALLTINPRDFHLLLDSANKDGLLFFPLEKTAVGVDGFMDVVKNPNSGEDFLWIGCLVRNYKDGQAFKKAYFKRNDREIGRMLGYPECCINYFLKAFPIDTVPLWVDLNGEVYGYPETNGILRYFGPKIVPHLSCSPTCQATRKIGKEWFKIMEEIDKPLADELYDLLAGPIKWNSYHGIAEIETPYFMGIVKSLYILKKPRIIDWKGEKKVKIKTPKRVLKKKSRKKK